LGVVAVTGQFGSGFGFRSGFFLGEIGGEFIPVFGAAFRGGGVGRGVLCGGGCEGRSGFSGWEGIFEGIGVGVDGFSFALAGGVAFEGFPVLTGDGFFECYFDLGGVYGGRGCGRVDRAIEGIEGKIVGCTRGKGEGDRELTVLLV
jgi:hypothetical protein